MLKKIIWFTGLSGSGKSTLSQLLNNKLLKFNYKTKIVDGDLFRKKEKNFKNFTKKKEFLGKIILKFMSTVAKKNY